MPNDAIPVPRRQLERWIQALRATQNLPPRDSQRLDRLCAEMEQRVKEGRTDAK